VTARDVGPGLVHASREWRVSGAPAEHVQPYLDSLAYRIDGAEGSIVFTGDTQPCESVVNLARGADMMLCMCWGDEDRNRELGETRGTCGTHGAARMAQEAGVKKLVLVHIGPELAHHGPMEKGIGDVRRLYDGEIVFADELMSITL
jgi:ribonuclease BN (tRNA processing enzyme)